MIRSAMRIIKVKSFLVLMMGMFILVGCQTSTVDEGTGQSEVKINDMDTETSRDNEEVVEPLEKTDDKAAGPDSVIIDVEDVEPIAVPVLMYHHIDENVTHRGVVTKDKFESDMDTLMDAGYDTIFLQDLRDYLKGEALLPDNPLIITFDDGYWSNYAYAYPVIKDRGMKITISVIGWSFGRDSFIDSDKPIIPHFDGEEAKEMLESGLVKLEHHTFDLHSEPGLSYGYGNEVAKGVLPLEYESFAGYKRRLSEDIQLLNQLFLDELDVVPEYFFFPYSAFNEESQRIVEELGFHGSLTTEPGIRRFTSIEDMMLIPRINIDQSLEGDQLLEAINEYLPEGDE